MREQGRNKTGIASLPHVNLLRVRANGRNTWMPSSPSQEASRGDASFGCSTFSQSSGRQETWEERRFLVNTQLMLLKKEKDPTSKQFDDDEWIRSLTEAQEVTTDVPEDSVMYDQQDVVPEKVRPIQMEEFLRKYVSRRLLVLSEGEIAALTTSMRQIGWVPRGAPRPWPSLTSSSTMNG